MLSATDIRETFGRIKYSIRFVTDQTERVKPADADLARRIEHWRPGMQNLKLFDKANSLAQIIVKDHEYTDIRARIRRLSERLEQSQGTDYQSR